MATPFRANSCWLRWAGRAAWAAWLLAAACAPASADGLSDLSAGIGYDDNLTRAQDRADRRADSAAALALVGSRLFTFGAGDTASLTALGNAEAYDRYRGLSHLELGVGASYRHKLGLGWNAPWLAGSGTLSRDDYRDRLRDSSRFNAQLEIGMRASPQCDVSAGVFYERRYDDHGSALVPGISGTVFDLAGRGVFTRAGYAISDRLQLDGRVALRTGDVESTSRPSLPVFLASTAIAADPVFGDPELFAYRLDGRTSSVSLTASWALDDRSSLNAGFLATRTLADQGLAYRSHVGNFTYAFRY